MDYPGNITPDNPFFYNRRFNSIKICLSFIVILGGTPAQTILMKGCIYLFTTPPFKYSLFSRSTFLSSGILSLSFLLPVRTILSNMV